MAFQNSNVTYGRGLGVVVNTGMYTEVGHIAGMLQDADETDTPLKQNLNNLSKVLTYAILVIALVTFVVGVFIQGKNPLGELSLIHIFQKALPVLEKIKEAGFEAYFVAVSYTHLDVYKRQHGYQPF